VNLLDENIRESQARLLRQWRIRFRQVGQDVGHLGIKDAEIISLLHGLGRTTLFTRDQGLYERRLCHPRYSLVCLDVGEQEVARFVRRLLRHPEFDTQARRMGKVVRAGHMGIRYWQTRNTLESAAGWPAA
jgi:hypothetical protein